MKRINMIYWDSDNFGDALSPLLIEELSGLKTQYKDLSLSRKERVVSVLNLDRETINRSLFPGQKVLGGIGSILSWLPKGTLVWGSGFMNKNDVFKGGEIYAVRGKFTADKLIEQGFSQSKVLGDPALLLPLWFPKPAKKQYKMGLTPHWKEVDCFKERYGDKYHVIDLRTKDVEKVISEIASCEFVLSTSLHGVIVAQAYGVPALWIKMGYIDTDGFKFSDYFSSVDIPLYNGFEDIEYILNNDDNWKSLFLDNMDKVNINNSLQDIQFDLLKSFPFPLKEKYQKLIQ